MKIIDNGINNQIIFSDNVQHELATTTINGSNNRIFIQKNTKIDAKIFIHGNDNELIIDESCKISGNIHIRQGSCIKIGKHTTFVFVNLFALEKTPIIIGEDCMFSSGIIIRNSDEHSIIDKISKQRINQASSVMIKNRVWLCENVYITKGVMIADEVIVGANSLVTNNLTENYALFAGNPAKLIKKDVTWDRQLL